jgi:hypothetical protein
MRPVIISLKTKRYTNNTWGNGMPLHYHKANSLKLRRHYIVASFEIALRTTSTLADFPLNIHLWAD